MTNFVLSKHAVDQMQKRGISREVVAVALQGKPKAHRKDADKQVWHGPKQADGRHVFVVTGNGRVITSYWLG